MDVLALRERALTLTDDEEFGWDTPASRRLLRCMMQQAMAETRRDLVAEHGPRLVEARDRAKEAREKTEEAVDKVWEEMREMVGAKLLGTLVKAGKVGPFPSNVVSGDKPG
jgi:hypothetical protein